ncbi:MAG: glutathione S-transferase family protein [Rhizobiaceae bacterium]
MLTLHTFPPALGTRSPSPFTLKVEALLTMAKLPYQKAFGIPASAPRQKFPVLQNGQQHIPDSAHIQRFLEQTYDIDFDKGLDVRTKSTALAYQHMIEDHLYFINVYFRWVEHGPDIKAAFFGEVPTPLRALLFWKIHRKVLKMLHMQGLGRHTRDELIEFVRQDLEALSQQLGDQPYLMGDQVTSVDASLYGALHNIIESDLETPLKQQALHHHNLVDYCQRFRREIFEDGTQS